MGRFLKITVALGLLAVAGFLGCMVLGKSRADRSARELFAAAAAEELQVFQERFHPGLVKSADPQQLARFLRELVEREGSFQGFRMNGFRFVEKASPGGHHRLYEGPAAFEKGEHRLKLEFLGEKLAAVQLQDQELGQALSVALNTVPPEHGLYADRGRDFWARALDGEAERAFGMLHQGLQKSIGLQGFTAQLAPLEKQGRLEEVRFLKSAPDPAHAGKLHLVYSVRFEKGNVFAHATVQFVGLHSHLVGFQLPSELVARNP